MERVWRCRSARGGRFFSVAANNVEFAITRLGGQNFFTIRGPETAATVMEVPANGEWVAIRFTAGTFMPRFMPGSLRDHRDVFLPDASTRAFWFNGSAIEYPSFENAETFVESFVASGELDFDPLVPNALRNCREAPLTRTMQRHFLRATGVTQATFHQIERARAATLMLREGRAIADVIGAAGYYDQAHLIRSLRRFIGETPLQIARAQSQLSFLYKTDWAREDTFSKTH